MEKINSKVRVLVTGSAGAIGGVVCPALRIHGYWVRGFDRMPSNNVDESVVADISDVPKLEEAVQGMDCVIHLLGLTRAGVGFLQDLLEPNIIGLYRVISAAHAAKVGKVILASSVQAAGDLLDSGKVLSTDEFAPRNEYAVTKVFAEMMGSCFSREKGLNVLAVRIGWFASSPAVLKRQEEHRHGPQLFLSHRDTARFFLAAVKAEIQGYNLVYLTSLAEPPLVDLSGCRALGYTPVDRFPSGNAFDEAGRPLYGEV